MRTRDEVTDDKLRGGFYSPGVLVDLCLDRAAATLGDRSDIRVLEPSSGDGAFLRGLARSVLRDRVEHVEAVELVESEAAKSSQALADLGLPGQAVHENVLRWADSAPADYDLMLANPPFVRFQFISDEDKQRAKGIAAALGTGGNSVSNLWIPVFLVALDKLRVGGVFSVILPTEFLTGVSASSVRNWLLANTTDLTIDLFKPGSFPAVLQEVLVLTGRKTGSQRVDSACVQFHDHNGGTHSWSHTIAVGLGTWTSFLLDRGEYEALAAVSAIKDVRALGSIARFSVSTVTGANNYFCLTGDQVDDNGLRAWAIPLLPRARHAQGLIFDAEDERQLEVGGSPAWMISFAADKPSPETNMLARRYLEKGCVQGIDQRFKCRVRSPWFRVPVVPAGDLLMSKRSNRYPRVIANHAGVVTTDTIYRGQMLPGSHVSADDFTATFHNSLTLLSAEIEGRSFGGGVLELVPSEISALRVPLIPGAGAELTKLDELARRVTDPDDLIAATDELVLRLLPALDRDVLAALGDARRTLMSRRMERTHAPFYA